MSEDRKLTDADVRAIVAELKSELVDDFYGEVGKGFWGWIKKALFGLLLLAALYGIAGDRAMLTHIIGGK